MAAVICKACGHEGRPASITPGSFIVEFGLWFVFGLAAFAYGWPVLLLPLGVTLWRLSAGYKGCRNCKSREIIPVDSPIGQQIRASVTPTPAPPPKPGAMGACPNCDATVSHDALICPKCQATFGPGSAWKVRAVP